MGKLLRAQFRISPCARNVRREQVDMNSPNQYVCCLALTTLGNTCSAEMARDLSSEVEKLLKSSNPLIRKKVWVRE